MSINTIKPKGKPTLYFLYGKPNYKFLNKIAKMKLKVEYVD